MDSNLPRLQLELYKEIKKVRKDVWPHVLELLLVWFYLHVNTETL